MASIVDHIVYNSVKPVGYPSTIKQGRFLPQSFFGSVNSNDIVRFIINGPGFWDPYSAYINIEIDVAGMDANTVQQLDGSAHSFINELIIYNAGTEIERISEYDVIADILHDM